VAVSTALGDQPGATAMALIVVRVMTRMGPLYTLDAVVGVLPSVV